MKKLLLVLIFFTGVLNAQDYTVQSIGFTPPHSYVQTNSDINVDDGYSGVLPIGFDFEFYGNLYSQLIIGGNGVINFNASEANSYCIWTFSEDIPSIDLEIKNAIYGVYHDLDPSISTISEINYAYYGTAPNRRFVVNFYEINHFTCNDIATTTQIVLYETTNNIDVYVKDKPVCFPWNNGNALLGIMNEDGTQGIAAPGRNTSDSPWEAYNEAWRFGFFDGNEVIANNVNFTICDDDGDGFGLFDLSLIVNDVIGNQNDVTVSFFETFLDANNNTNPIVSNLYLNTINPQTLYARVENTNGLFETSDVTLQVVTCLLDDSDDDGVTNSQEDLNGDGILNNDDTDNDGIPNYLDADDDGDMVSTLIETTGTGAGILPSVYVYIDTDNDAIENYLDNDDDGDGIVTAEEDYNLNGNPLDDDVNLNSIPDFLDVNVSIVPNSALCDNVMLDPTYVGCEGDEIVLSATCANAIQYQWFRDGLLINGATTGTLAVTVAGEYTLAITDVNATSFTDTQVIFEPIPVINPISDYLVCDMDGDGLAIFNLTNKDSEILNGQLDVIVTYFETLNDATADENEITIPINYTSPSAVIWVRLESLTTGCFTISSFNLIVNLAPEVVNTPENLIVFDTDDFATFDLTSNESLMLGGQNPAGFDFTYFLTEADCFNNTNPIVNPTAFNNTSNPQTVYVQFQDLITGCFICESFDVIVEEELGLGDNTFLDITIYPNPTTGLVTISNISNSTFTSIELFTIEGKQMFIDSVLENGDDISLNISALTNGIYFVKIKAGNNEVVKRIVKQ